MPELQLNPKKTALVLIDLNNIILGFNTTPYAPAQVVERSKKLAEAFRAVKADQDTIRLQNEYFEKTKNPVDTKQ